MEATLAAITKHLVNFKQIDGTTLSAESVYSGKVVARYYFDLSNRLAQPNTDVSAYIGSFQENYITPDYFDIPGSIQWNYYLLIISNQIDPAVKDQVEKEKSYTRKFVISPNELDEFFQYSVASGSQVEDIVEVWKAKLSESDLDTVIMSKISYVDGVESILRGDPKIERSSESLANHSTQPQIGPSQLAKLKLGQTYRPFPVDREFYFGRVNLIRGSNGSGKTSLIEAIEFGYCGQILRNKNENNTNPGIQIQFVGSDVLETVDISDKDRYRQRDRNWFGHAANANLHRDGIEERFNKFNFFDSDAGYKIGNQEANFAEALTTLIAGPEANVTNERLKGFKRRFEYEKGRLESEESTARTAIRDKSLELDRIRSAQQDVYSAFAKLRSAVSESLLTDTLPNAHTEALNVFSDWLGAVEQMLGRTARFDQASVDLDLEHIRAKILNMQNALGQYEAEIAQIALLRNNISQIRAEYSLSERKQSLLKDSLKFVKEPRIEEIIGLSNKISELRDKLSFLRGVLAEFFASDWAPIMDYVAAVGDLRADLEGRIAAKRSEFVTLRSQLQQIRSGLDELNRIRLEIKDLGRQFIQIEPKTEECPLCNQPHGAFELEKRILEAVNSIENSSAASMIAEQLSTCEAEGIKYRSQAELLNQLITITNRIVENEEWKEMALKDIRALFFSKFEEAEFLETELLQLESLASIFEQGGLKESDFLSIRREIQSSFDLEVKHSNLGAFEVAVVELSKEHELRVSQLLEIEEALKGHENAAKRTLALDESERLRFSSENPLDSFRAYIRELRSLEELLAGLHVLILRQPFPTILEIKNAISEIRNKYEQYQRQLKLQSEATVFQNALSAEIERATESLERVTPRKERAQAAFKALDSILREHSIETYLDEFLESHRAEIVNIFVDIHSPREFQDVKYEDKKIFLFREDSSNWVDLFEISTGQRSALALSIFLALNRTLRNGPEVLIFDDPVTFIDDLNTLNFFDYLRKVAIHGKRQIFFATAGDKIANLFEHKFDFLGDEVFKTFIFERPYYSPSS